MTSRRPGRPPSALPDLQPFTARLSPRAKRRLMALSQVKADPAYELLEEGFWALWESLPANEKEAAEAIARAVERVRGEESGGGEPT
ncbi:MAG TPA: hypothetical protein VLF66_01980 [Thermoanaerobaculia bacterium]|nr:hypothetical protein [Thermoanaerobaculia bacterium]